MSPPARRPELQSRVQTIRAGARKNAPKFAEGDRLLLQSDHIRYCARIRQPTFRFNQLCARYGNCQTDHPILG